MTTLSRWRDRWRRLEDRDPPWLGITAAAIGLLAILACILLAGHASPGG